MMSPLKDVRILVDRLQYVVVVLSPLYGLPRMDCILILQLGSKQTLRCRGTLNEVARGEISFIEDSKGWYAIQKYQIHALCSTLQNPWQVASIIAYVRNAFWKRFYMEFVGLQITTP